jgi:cytochrome P450 family 13
MGRKNSTYFTRFYLWHLCGYWQRLSIPGPRPKLLVGNLDALFFGNQSAVLTLNEWTKQFGPIYGIRYGHKNLLVISEPEMVHELLVTKFSNFHGRLVKLSIIINSGLICLDWPNRGEY